MLVTLLISQRQSFLFSKKGQYNKYWSFFETAWRWSSPFTDICKIMVRWSLVTLICSLSLSVLRSRGWLKRGLLACFVIFILVPVLLRILPELIQHLVYTHRRKQIPSLPPGSTVNPQVASNKWAHLSSFPVRSQGAILRWPQPTCWFLP